MQTPQTNQTIKQFTPKTNFLIFAKTGLLHFLSSHVHPLHGNPYSSHHIYHLAFSPMIVLIDVSLSHLFVFLLHHISLFAILSVNSRAYAHPLHECSKYRKGVDQIDLYLASGLGTSQDKIPKRTKCETLVD